MADALIENPILNSAFAEPTRHFHFGETGITSEVVDRRRPSSYFVPIPASKKSAQMVLTEWTGDRIEENDDINAVRRLVETWRAGDHPDITPTTRRLLDHWRDPDRERRLFFCQIEAAETAIFLAEAAPKHGGAWVRNKLDEFSEQYNPGLRRIAFKMATGSGKTVLMAMFIAWQALNKRARPQDNRFSDAFLVVTPGITIRDRLRVLLPQDPGNYYRALDIVPPGDMDVLGEARIAITNFHGFQPRERVAASKTTKQILARDGQPSAFAETPDQMVRRACRDLGQKRGIIVLNDEAHHCYRHPPTEEESAALKGDDLREAKQREQEARVWISGLEAINSKIGVRTVYDLSATPFFLRGSGYPEGRLFPWVMSDFSLIDAIESGVVKIPRVPVSDDSMMGKQPTYRDIWARIRTDLPKKSRKDDAVSGEPKLPNELGGALHSLYDNYTRAFEQFSERKNGATPPVFIVVCNNTNVSKLVFDYVAGWEKPLPDDRSVVVPGQLPLFSNERDGGWADRPNTILIDSTQLESGEAMSADFKRVASREIEEFKSEYRARFPGRDTDDLTDEDLLREVMNTVGKPGRLGEHIRCVVSVSMLTEGWDANTVTHILGVRAFGTQLLCEQVVGRGLRRMSYTPDSDGMFHPEYAEVYGVPFSFIPCSGATPTPKPAPVVTRIRALPERAACEIRFPRIVGYRYELSGERLRVEFSEPSKMALSTQDVPTLTDIAGIVGATDVHTLDDLRRRREQEVVFELARRLGSGYFPDRPWLFPQLVGVCRSWMAECLQFKDHSFPQMLLLHQHAQDAADRIHKAIVASDPGEKMLVAVLAAFDAIGSTAGVDFDTSKKVMRADPSRCHLSHVVADSDWEHKMAQVLESKSMPEVRAYVKNQGLDFRIPYTINGDEHYYLPDFLVRVDDGHGEDDLLTLIVEVSGQKKRDKDAKTATARDLWVPAVNNLGEFGRWAFCEITDPWDAQKTIREAIG